MPPRPDRGALAPLVGPDRLMFPARVPGHAGAYSVGAEADVSDDDEEAAMHTTATPTAHPARPSGARVAVHAEQAVQRVADASVWLIFRLNRVRS